MTESEAAERIRSGICMEIGTQKYCHDNCMHGTEHCAYSMAIKALEFMQQCREIGTIEEIKTAMKYASLAKKHGTIGKVIDSCVAYEIIGTSEEFNALKEKEQPKQAIKYNKHYYKCPVCDTDTDVSDDDIYVYKEELPSYCKKCGQKIMYQRGEK